MTRRKALVETRNMWTWLMENPDKKKGDWPGTWPGEWESDCPCCQHVLELDNTRPRNCTLCPLQGVAWDGQSYPCENDPGSPYLPWSTQTSTSKTRREAAQRIMWCAITALKELDEQEKTDEQETQS